MRWFDKIDHAIFDMLFVLFDIAIASRVVIFLYFWLRRVIRTEDGGKL